MKGYIGLIQHKIDCIIGIYPEERKINQTIYVDVKVEADFSKCSRSDSIEDTVNYELLADICTTLAVTRKYKLLETFAVEALKEILYRFNVPKAWICIRKPKAIASADYTVVELELTTHEQ